MRFLCRRGFASQAVVGILLAAVGLASCGAADETANEPPAAPTTSQLTTTTENVSVVN